MRVHSDDKRIIANPQTAAFLLQFPQAFGERLLAFHTNFVDAKERRVHLLVSLQIVA